MYIIGGLPQPSFVYDAHHKQRIHITIAALKHKKNNKRIWWVKPAHWLVHKKGRKANILNQHYFKCVGILIRMFYGYVYTNWGLLERMRSRNHLRYASPKYWLSHGNASGSRQQARCLFWNHLCKIMHTATHAPVKTIRIISQTHESKEHSTNKI